MIERRRLKIIDFLTINYNQKIPEYILNQIIDNEYILQIQLRKDQGSEELSYKESIDDFEDCRQEKHMIYNIAINADINRVIGSICYYENKFYVNRDYYIINQPNALHISQFFVNQLNRRQGIGTKLIQNVIKYVQSLNLSGIDLNTTAKNINAQKFYKDNNFDIIFNTMGMNILNNNIDNVQYNLIDNVDNDIEDRICISIKRLKNHFDNNFPFDFIKNEIFKMIQNNTYKIINIDDLYVVFSIQKNNYNNRLKLFDFLLYDNQYDEKNILKLLNVLSIYAHQNNSNYITIKIPYNKTLFFQNLGFENKMFHLYRKI